MNNAETEIKPTFKKGVFILEIPIRAGHTKDQRWVGDAITQLLIDGVSAETAVYFATKEMALVIELEPEGAEKERRAAA